MSVLNSVQAVPHWLVPLTQYLESKFGLDIKESQFREAGRNFSNASRHFGFEKEAECLNWLLSGEQSNKVLSELAAFFTIGETYFFREKNSFEPMTRQILGEIIERKNRAGERRIRIWSAACCSGEEPYSIAILLNELLPFREHWDIQIKATDLNTDYLKRAQEGIYRKWSFRGTPEWVTRKHFEVKNEEYTIKAPVKRQVEFEWMNLAEDNYPSGAMGERAFDLIFCRNVLIYFTDTKATEVTRRLKACLVEDGWLVVSPPELGFVEADNMTRHMLGNSIFHQKRVDTSNRISSYPVRTKTSETRNVLRQSMKNGITERIRQRTATSKPASSSTGDRHARPAKEEIIKAGEQALQSGNPEAARRMLASLTDKEKDSSELDGLMARVLLKLDSAEEALVHIRRATNLDKANSEHHLMEGSIHLELQDMQAARAAFERVLYLDPYNCKALYLLAILARQAERKDTAEKLFIQLSKSLARMPTGQIVFEEDAMTAGKLLARIQQLYITSNEVGV